VGEHAQQKGFSGAGASGAAKSWANIRARSAREAAAAREADRAEVYAWPVQMWRARAASQIIAQCLNGDTAGWKSNATAARPARGLPLDAIRRPRDTPIWKLEAALKCRSCKKGRYATRSHGEADYGAGDHALRLGAS